MNKTNKNISNIAGLCVKGGRKDNFFLCLLEYFEDSNRWFLSSTLHFKNEMGTGRDDAIKNWLEKYNIDKLIVNFPLSNTACEDCQLECPGINLCPDLNVKEVQFKMNASLETDSNLHKKHPKTYEEMRVLNDQEEIGKALIKKNFDTTGMISRAYRRRLKKGFLPYWNRTLDYFIWNKYFDLMLDFFKTSFDSFGTTSLMVMSRFTYMKKHFSKDMKIYESNANLNLLELYKAGIISNHDLEDLDNAHTAYEARVSILKKIEQNLGIFIYEHDVDLIADHPLAFESFLLGAVGVNIINGKYSKLPNWTSPDKTRFIIPNFL